MGGVGGVASLLTCSQTVGLGHAHSGGGCWGRGLTLDILSDCGSGTCTQWGCVGGVASLSCSQTVGLAHAHSGGGVGGVASLLACSQTVGLGHAHSGGVLGAWSHSHALIRL